MRQGIAGTKRMVLADRGSTRNPAALARSRWSDPAGRCQRYGRSGKGRRRRPATQTRSRRAQSEG
eukprot:6788027-Prymnesium_polylepis.1